ncbi:HD family phosphohydrolase [Carnobacterium divergens]|uniref:Phosphohydrolase n=1 Tax=Carnobacterium divergens TaxID=2748 RepID=A0A7Z8CX49_CARDV|nr:HDIG domain-containing metalloprotein [Carnobacterium divergens]TFI71316.1 phosphohydrolase [Carnobacterium divergens]TFI75958.1 phosphohydrolase [Carnobacterium divergens]TFI81830.1 phosphohydrolase [Carnobacterium divergens]TFI94139.1 phosphohydrolase [Carnobacterium divergens]TFJ10419.1 phosphohydrolase [Carnobacterium divergens]
MKRIIVSIQKKMGKFYIPFVLALFSLILFFIIFDSVKPKSLDLRLYQVADETVRANATIEDKEKTKENQKAASESVQPVYQLNSNLVNTQLSKLEILFATIEDIRTQYQDKTKKIEETTENRESAIDTLNKEKTVAFREKMKSSTDQANDFSNDLPDWAIVQLLNMESATLKSVKENTWKIVKEKMSKAIRDTDLTEVKQEAKDKLEYSNLTGNNLRTASLIVENSIVENEILNEKATEEQKQMAVERVQPAMILQGQVLVQEGHIVDSNAMNQIELLGLLDKTASYRPIYALILVLITQMLILYYLEMNKKNRLIERGQHITLYIFVMVFGVIVMKGLQLIQSSGANFLAMLYPAALIPLLVTVFVSRRFGIIANGFLAAFSIFIFIGEAGTSFSLVVTLFYLLSGMMGTMLSRARINRQLWPTFIWITIFNSLFVIAFVLYLNMQPLSRDGLLILLYGVLSGLASYILAIVLNPYIEVLFEDNAVLTLTELANPNQPLLKELLIKAAGTYHHSLMVANLSANAVEEIGGDSMFARVACYYHDVGKIKHPFFFVENLPPGMENPHNILKPEESKEIIFNHVTEGVKMLEEAKLPKGIVDICAQHHGTTLMKFFYVKAKEANQDVLESDFRYPGPKPQTKEAAVINIADSCEAAIRAMSQPTTEKIATFVHELINGRIIDGQFDECAITLKELHQVELSICEGLNGTFHSRIEYPTLKKNNATNEGKS